MGNKLYRIKQILVSIAVKYALKEKAQKAVQYILNKSQVLKSKGLTKKQTIVISTLLIACLVIVLWPSNRLESPLNTIDKLEQAIIVGDTTKAVHMVDIETIASDISKAVISQINSKKLTQDLLSYMEKELENKIINDFYDIVDNKGNFEKTLNDSSAVLSKTLNFLFNKSGKIIARELVKQNDDNATIKITVFRPDLNQEINIELLMEYIAEEWSIKQIKNTAGLLKKLEAIEEARIDKLNSEIKENFNSFVILKDFQKSNLNIKDNSFLMRLSLENISNEDIKHVEGTLNLIYQNQLLGTINIKIPETIYANNFYEKAWSIKLNDYKSLSNLAKTSSKNIKARLDIEKIVFAKGNVIELIK